MDTSNRQEPPQYYDQMYKKGGKGGAYHKPAEEHPHASIWFEIIGLLPKDSTAKILELGCGPGHFAEILITHGFNYLRGIDFSMEAIRMAQERPIGSYKFKLGDVLDKRNYENLDYNTVICTEVLEHIKDDLQLIKQLKKGTVFFGTVPNFGGRAHVRYFENQEEVRNRYGPLGKSILTWQKGKIFTFKLVL